MKQKQLNWIIASLFSVPACQYASAQQVSAPTAAPEVQTVVVSGIRASVRDALTAKENSNSIVEVVASEDIGKLPDTTIAESLARLPGLSAGYDRGNASQIVARGMGPRFIGATLNGRELASSEPNRAVRFEQFPSESLSGATVYKTQAAELVEGGIATSIDLQTVQPLKYNGRQASLKADVLHYAIASKIDGAEGTKPRVGGIYLDQFANKSVGVAIAFSHQVQPSISKNINSGGFNEDHSVDLTGDGKVDRTPWGLGDGGTVGVDTRSSLLGKVEWKISPQAMITGDLYYATAKIDEPGFGRWLGNGVGNWDGGQSADYSNVDSRNGYVVGAKVKNVTLVSNDTVWIQDMDNLAGGLNGKFRLGDWKLEADLSTSRAGRDSQWRDVRIFSRTGNTLTWSLTGPDNLKYDYGFDTGNPANFYANTPTLYINTDGHIEDRLSAVHLNAARKLDLGLVDRVKFGVRVSDRVKSYHQTTWDVAPTGSIPNSAYHTVNVEGMPPLIRLNDFYGTVAQVYGPNAFNVNGRMPTDDDRKASWRVTERSESIYAQADLSGELFGKPVRGNAGVRVVHTRQAGEGLSSDSMGWVEQPDGSWKEVVTLSPSKDGTSYTEILPSMNLIFNMTDQQQLRFSMARAMSRAPIDEMRGAQNIWRPSNPMEPLSGGGGNTRLLPMMSNQLDLAYQWYFGKGNLFSAGAFYKQVSRYITINTDRTKMASSDPLLNGRDVVFTRSVNGKGGDMRGLELIYQQNFNKLPAPFDGLGLSSNYAYTTSNVKEAVPAGDPYPIEGLIKHLAGLTLWYEKGGYEARLSANYHSPVPRTPGWDAGKLITNEAETWVSMSFSKHLTPKLQLRFGIENLTDQKSVSTSAKNPASISVSEFGRRYNLGLSYKL
ncbi:MAG: TonB-dependent receptor [Pseudomonadota bacterium]